MSQDQAAAQADEQDQRDDELADELADEQDDEQGIDAVREAVAVERTVSHALFDYTDLRTGAPRTALFGQRIHVGPEDLARGQADGALTDGALIVPGLVAVVPAPTPEVLGGSEPAPAPDADGGHLGPLDPAAAAVVGGQDGNPPDRPYQTSKKGVWEEYVVRSAVFHGDDTMTHQRAKGMTKDELMAWAPAS